MITELHVPYSELSVDATLMNNMKIQTSWTKAEVRNRHLKTLAHRELCHIKLKTSPNVHMFHDKKNGRIKYMCIACSL